MFQTLLISINTIIFLFISGLHVYWAFGGKWGMHAVIPTKTESQEKAFQPGFFSTMVVATGLLLFALVMLSNLGLWDNYLNRKYIYYATIVIASIFLIRGIGDFKYAGIFKRIKNTTFAKNDTKIFVPLCFAIAILAFMIAYLSH
jgi:Protein of unknown function (DUF3995)